MIKSKFKSVERPDQTCKQGFMAKTKWR